MPTKTFGVSIDLENYEKVKEEAKKLDRSMSWIMNKAVEVYFLRKEQMKNGS